MMGWRFWCSNEEGREGGREGRREGGMEEN